MPEGFVDMYSTVRYRLFRWERGLEWYYGLLLSLGLACFTGVLAQIRVVLPWTPVPVTGQVFAVLLCGVLGGRRWGTASQMIYVGLGAAGVPWLAGFASGLTATGGYLFGFILAA